MARLAFVAATALSISACDTMTNPFGPAAPATPVVASAYVAMAASGDIYEIESSRLAQQRAQDPRHRRFADMMIREHTVTTTQLRAAAQAAGMMVPNQMQPVHMRMIDQLVRSANFDATYHQQQIDAHRMALALHGNYAARGDRSELRGFAALTAPVVRRHLDEMQRM